MPDESSFDELIGRLRAGDKDAPTQIFYRYSRQLIAMARTQLGIAVQHKVDAEEVVQSVYRSFFHRFADDAIELENWGSLWGILVTITLRKCGRQLDYLYADKRDIRKERPHPIPNKMTNDESSAQWEAIAQDPTPLEATVLSETVQCIMQKLTERQREIFSLILQGYSQEEVRQKVGCSTRTVGRTLQMARRQLEAIRKDET